jgi:signal transduction histidine kinase
MTRNRRAGVGDSTDRAHEAELVGRLHPGLVAGIMIFLSVGASTLIFWYFASTTGLVNLSEGALYLIRSAGLAGLLIGAVGLFIVVSAFRRAALPIANMLAATERVAAGDYDIQVDEQGPREVRILARAFNAMSDQLRTRDAASRRLAAEIGRELLTSVNGMMQSIQVLPATEDEHLRAVHERADRLSRLIHDAHTLALALNGQLSLAPEPTDLCVLLPDTISGLHREASARGVSLSADIPDPSIFFVVDPRRFRQILWCLLVNALARSPANTEIRVDLSELTKPTQVQLKVTDHGSPVAPEELPFIFERVNQSNEIATGLELVVVKQLVQAQRGEVLATSMSEGGTSIAVLLPPDTPRV